ncbi:hypothetical protein [Blastococcus montanus]|uniref:hypothetical protein n=1 Tax=Blastococcus montanus TaxID=3144973 RepID=UPI0032080C6A
MGARTPARARFLGLWTAGWLALFLIVGMVRFGDPSVQWPVLVVPLLWALVALRPRRAARDSRPARARPEPAGGPADDEWADEWAEADRWPDEDPRWPPPGARTDTVERPALRRRDDGPRDRW